jgi:uncharacterized membrane protein
VTAPRARGVMRWALAVLYFAAGVAHILAPDGFVAITPDWVPLPREVILATGVCEIAGAVGLLTGSLRRLAGAMLALYAVCVYPANIKHAIDNVAIDGVTLGWWYHGPRLLLQPVLVWSALFCVGLVDWPARRG